MAEGFKIASFFAKIGFKVDEKELNKITEALKKISAAQDKMSKASEGNINKERKAKTEAIAREKKQQADLFKFKDAHSKEVLNDTKREITEKQRLAAVERANATARIRQAVAIITRGTGRRRATKADFLTAEETFVGPLRPKGLAQKVPKEVQDSFDKFMDSTATLNKLNKVRTDRLVMLKKRLKLVSDESKRRNLTLNQTNTALNVVIQKEITLARTMANGTRAINRQSLAMKRLKSSTMQLAQTYVGAFAIFQGVRSINRVGQDFEGMRSAMLASSGSTAQAAKDLAFVDKEAVRLGLDLKDTTDAFSKLQFAAAGKIGRKDLRQIFVGFSEFAVALKVGPEQQKAGLRALQQMLNKTTIMSEELKQQ